MVYFIKLIVFNKKFRDLNQKYYFKLLLIKNFLWQKKV